VPGRDVRGRAPGAGGLVHHGQCDGARRDFNRRGGPGLPLLRPQAPGARGRGERVGPAADHARLARVGLDPAPAALRSGSHRRPAHVG
jgi:hypothetical protein